MDLDMHTMVLVDTIVLTDIYGVERRGKLKLLLKLQLLLILMLRLIPGMDTMDMDTTWVNEEQDCNICKHLYMCTHLCSTHVHTKSTKDVLTTTTCAHSLSFQAVPSCNPAVSFC